jgi:hypothetical protein
LQRAIAILDASIARGDLETSSADLANLLGWATTGPTEIVRAAYERLKLAPGAKWFKKLPDIIALTQSI